MSVRIWPNPKTRVAITSASWGDIDTQVKFVCSSFLVRETMSSNSAPAGSMELISPTTSPTKVFATFVSPAAQALVHLVDSLSACSIKPSIPGGSPFVPNFQFSLITDLGGELGNIMYTKPGFNGVYPC
jgi:hypothetical protein